MIVEGLVFSGYGVAAGKEVELFGVAGDGGFAFGGDGTSGMLRVAAIGVDLGCGGHVMCLLAQSVQGRRTGN